MQMLVVYQFTPAKSNRMVLRALSATVLILAKAVCVENRAWGREHTRTHCAMRIHCYSHSNKLQKLNTCCVMLSSSNGRSTSMLWGSLAFAKASSANTPGRQVKIIQFHFFDLDARATCMSNENCDHGARRVIICPPPISN